MSSTRRERGFALLLTLWLLVPIALSLLTMSGTARVNAEIASNLEAAAVLGAAADGGIATALASLVATHDAAASTSLQIGAAAVPVTVTVVVEPLSGLLNPNLASPEILRSLLVRVGATPARADLLATAIVEWRSPGQSRRAGSTKAAEYAAAGLDYGPPGAPFETLAELLDVIGMTPGLFAALRPNLSLFTDRPPDPALAPPTLRAALLAIGTTRPAPADQGAVFRIVATATRPGRAAVARQAVVLLAPGLRPWRILLWDKPPGLAMTSGSALVTADRGRRRPGPA